MDYKEQFYIFIYIYTARWTICSVVGKEKKRKETESFSREHRNVCARVLTIIER